MSTGTLVPLWWKQSDTEHRPGMQVVHAKAGFHQWLGLEAYWGVPRLDARHPRDWLPTQGLMAHLAHSYRLYLPVRPPQTKWLSSVLNRVMAALLVPVLGRVNPQPEPRSSENLPET